MSKRKNVKVGDRYGMLVVKSLLPERDRFGYRMFECVCDCGGRKTVRSVNLNHGQTRSCGCLLVKTATAAARKLGGWNKKPLGESSFTYLYNQYRGSARCRLVLFTLTKEQFRALVTSRCYYCGAVPSQSVLRKTPSGGQANGAFVYNGIDRIDTTKGYTAENSRTACKACNLAKGTRTESEFKAWIQQVHRHWCVP